MCAVSKTVDVIVIGVGGMGSAACHHLATQDVDVLGLERYDIPHAMGSSHGSTRILRFPQYEHPSYVPLVREASRLWEELEQQHESQLFQQTGTLDIGSSESDIVNGSVESCKKHGLEYELLDGDEVNKRYPGYELPSNYHAVYQPDGGFLIPEQCIIAHVRSAVAAGADIRAREAVEDWQRTESGVRVQTARGVYEANQLVITAGAWAGKQISELRDLLTPERQVMAWFQPTNPDYFAPENFPVFVMDSSQGHFYGFPEYDIPGFKFAKFRHRNQLVNPDTMEREPTEADETPLREFASSFFPNGNGATMRLKTCLFTHTPDGHFIVDRLDEKVVVACGFSGHGFKFSSVIGEILADLVEEGDTNHEIGLFSADRF